VRGGRLIGNNNNYNDKDKKPKHKYVKVLVKDPFNNRDIILCPGRYIYWVYYGFTNHNNYFRAGYNNNTLLCRKYSTSALDNCLNNPSSKLHPYFVTGFSDGEGCFSMTIFKHDKLKIG
jgi:hypothetical protein